jgi:hypothetical protein
MPGPDLFRAEPVRDELRVDTRLADAAGDQLAVLAAEVEDEDRALVSWGNVPVPPDPLPWSALADRRLRIRLRRRRKRDDLSLADSSALPS